MKTCEMIRELTENQDKQFKAINSNNNLIVKFYKEIKVSDLEAYSNVMGIESDIMDVEILSINAHTLSYIWEEIKQPYTFEEAYKECKENGIRFTDGYNILEKDDSDNICICRKKGEEIKVCLGIGLTLTGKWYKED